jgi:DNA-binding SARP family transcriptional activator
MEPQKDATTSLKVTLFASFQVWLNGISITDFATNKARALLVYLVVERQQPHRREQLAAMFWPDQPDARARKSLQQALTHLRQALGDDDQNATPFLLVERQDVQFNPQADLWLDVAQFAELVAANERHHHRQPAQCLPCLRRLETMLALYDADFLAGFSLHDSMPFEKWLLLKREWFHCQAMEALGYLADFYERRGEFASARRYAQKMVHLEPWCEEAHRQLMRLLAYEGQRSAALAQYKACRRALKREFGLDPTSKTNNLHRAIRDGVLLADSGQAAPLPAMVTPFVGRKAECAELAEMLANPDGRLVTVVGPGGVGKTRLALQTAADHLGVYADGVCWVALATVHSVALIIPTLAQALGFVLYGKEPAET